MSFDYSFSDRQLNLPNPFKIEIIFLGISAATISGLGLLLLFSARAKLNDTIRSSTNVIKIESMTYRLWCANLTSATFGKDSARHIVAMAGDTNFTETMTFRRKEFALNQASIFAPVSRADLERHAALTNLNEASRDPETLQKLTSQLQQTATPQAVQIGATLLVQCPACGSGVETKDIFCGDCGQKLKAA